jgi:hypothetical protein
VGASLARVGVSGPARRRSPTRLESRCGRVASGSAGEYPRGGPTSCIVAFGRRGCPPDRSRLTFTLPGKVVEPWFPLTVTGALRNGSEVGVAVGQ